MAGGLQRIIMRDMAAKILRKAADDLEIEQGRGSMDADQCVDWLRAQAETLEKR